jgi:hypothetical protein
MENPSVNASEIQFNNSLSERLMEELRNAIERNNKEDYKKLLYIVPLKNVPFEKTNKLLLILLRWLDQSKFVDGLKETLTYWSGMETGFDEYEGEIYPVIPTLFLDPKIPFHALYYIMESLRDVLSVEEIAIELFEKGTGDNLKIALRNLFDMLGKPSGETFRVLTDEAINSGNETAIQFMSGLQSYYTEPARRPDYIIVDQGEGEEGQEEQGEEQGQEPGPEELDEKIEEEVKEKLLPEEVLLMAKMVAQEKGENKGKKQGKSQRSPDEDLLLLQTMIAQNIEEQNLEKQKLEKLEEEKEVVPELLSEKDCLEAAMIIADEIYEKTEYDDLDANVIFLTSGLEKYGLEIVDINQARKVLYDKLSAMTSEQRKVYLTYVNQESMDQLVKSNELFNILGPANAIINGDFKKTDHICYRYGGCRMLYCNCFEFEQMDIGKDELEIEFPNIPQWFKGQCERCDRVVQKRCYAVRRPLPQGGWRGTYCSWNCLYLSGNVEDQLSMELCNLMENQLNEMGIIDREEMDVEQVLKEKVEEIQENS